MIDKKDVKFYLAVVGVIVAFCAIMYFIRWFSCTQSAQAFDNKYNIIAGCMVKHEDKWLPLENIRGFGG